MQCSYNTLFLQAMDTAWNPEDHWTHKRILKEIQFSWVQTRVRTEKNGNRQYRKILMNFSCVKMEKQASH